MFGSPLSILFEQFFLGALAQVGSNEYSSRLPGIPDQRLHRTGSSLHSFVLWSHANPFALRAQNL
jgi:hypothetical protein